MEIKKREKSRLRRNLSFILIIGVIIISLGIVSAADNPAMKKYFGGGTVDKTNIRTFTQFINDHTDGLTRFREIWTTSTPEERANFRASLVSTTPTVSAEDVNNFYEALLKSKYKEIKDVNLGKSKNIDIDDKLENIVIRGDKGGEFKLPISSGGERVPLVSMKNDDGIIKLGYQIKDGKEPRVLSIIPGLKGSIDPSTGLYINEKGDKTNIGLLNGWGGGELKLSMSDNKLRVEMAKIDVSKLTPEQQNLYAYQGVGALQNQAVLVVGNDNFFASGSPSSQIGNAVIEIDPSNTNTFSVKDAEAAVYSPSKEDGKIQQIAYVRNSATYQFSHETGSPPTDSNINFEGKMIFYDNKDNPETQSYDLRFGKNVYAGIGLTSQFNSIDAYGATDDNIKGEVVVNDNGVPSLKFKDGKLYTALDGKLVECQTGSVDCVGFPLLGGLARVTVRGVGLVGRGVGAVGGGVVNFFREVQPIRTIGGVAIRGVGAIGRVAIGGVARVGGFAIRGVGAVGGGVLRAGGGAVRGVFGIFRRW